MHLLIHHFVQTPPGWNECKFTRVGTTLRWNECKFTRVGTTLGWNECKFTRVQTTPMLNHFTSQIACTNEGNAYICNR